jgi:hypothetical protein
MHKYNNSINPAIYTEKKISGRRKPDPQHTAEILIGQLVKKIKDRNIVNKPEWKTLILTNFPTNDLNWFVQKDLRDYCKLLCCLTPSTGYTGTHDEQRITSRIRNLINAPVVKTRFDQEDWRSLENDVLNIAKAIQKIHTYVRVPWRGGYGKRSKIVTRRVGQVKTGVSRNWLHKKRATRRKKRQDSGGRGFGHLVPLVAEAFDDYFTGDFTGDKLIGTICIVAYAVFQLGVTWWQSKRRASKEKKCDDEIESFKEEIDSTIKNITDNADVLATSILDAGYFATSDISNLKYRKFNLTSDDKSSQTEYILPKHILDKDINAHQTYEAKRTILEDANQIYKLKKINFKEKTYIVALQTENEFKEVITTRDANIDKEKLKLSKQELANKYDKCIKLN